MKIKELIGVEGGLISPEKPFSNKVIIWNTIKSCEGYIYWIDKYFSKEGHLFKDFRSEMKNDQIFCEMRVIVDSKLKSSIHDRWLISKNNSFNIPSPDVVARGQYSEVKITHNIPPFDEWWNKSLDMIDDWNKLQSIKNQALTDRTAT